MALIGRPLVSGALDRRADLVSTNTKVDVSKTATVLARGKRVCAPDVYVPDEASFLRIYPGSSAPGVSRLRLVLRRASGGPVLLTRTVRVARPGAPLDVGLGPAEAAAAEVCVTNVGRRDVSVANREDTGDTFAGRPGIPRVDVLEGGHPRALALVPDAVGRAGLFKGDLVRPWVLVLLALLAAGAFASAIVLVLRDPADDEGERS